MDHGRCPNYKDMNQEAFDKERNGLAERKMFTVVDRPPDRDPLGTTMVWKYKIDNVNHTVTRKCTTSLGLLVQEISRKCQNFPRGESGATVPRRQGT